MADKNIYDHEKQKLFDEIYRDTIENHEGCWLWAKSCFKQGGGYGQKKVKRVNWHVHRLIYTIVHGAIPDGVIIRHRCGESLCCNPLHLEPGTLKDNARDSKIHGTCHFTNLDQDGVKNHMAKLDENAVYEMRKLYGTGEYTFKQLGEMFGCSRKPAERAVRGTTYLEYTKVAPIPYGVYPKKKES